MCIDLHSLDIKVNHSISASRNREIVHRYIRCPTRILIFQSSKRKNLRDLITRHRTNFSISLDSHRLLPLPPIPPHLFLHEKILRAWTTMDHFPLWLTVARGGIACLLLARKERRKFSCFLFAGVHDKPWIPFTFPHDISNLIQRISSLLNRVENRELGKLASICIRLCFEDTRLLE